MEFKPSKNEYEDSAEFTEDLAELQQIAERLQILVGQPAFAKWLRLTDQNYNTDCAPYITYLKHDVKQLVGSVEGLVVQIDKADQ